MARLLRRKSPMLRKRSFLHRWWSQLDAEKRRTLIGLYYGFSFHSMLLALLYAIGFAAPGMAKPLELLANMSGEATETVLFSLADPPELDESINQLAESAEVLEIEDTPELALSDLELPDVDLSSQAVSEASENTLESIETPSSFQDMSSDDLVSETDRRVAIAGGKTEGVVRVSLIYSGRDDLDLHVQYGKTLRSPIRHRFRGGQPGYSKYQYWISYMNRQTVHGVLDVDANAHVQMQYPCENIVFKAVPKNTNFVVGVHHYRRRGSNPVVPFVVVVRNGRRKEQIFKGEARQGQPLQIVQEFRYRS
ncbi:MAG: hypothetical protein Aurels2KO_54990 [Aureliella sp.]